MATYTQRFNSILTAVLDAVPTAEQSAAITDAYVGLLSDDVIRARFGVERATLTPSNKARIVVTVLRSDIRRALKEYARVVAEAANRNNAAVAEQTAGSILSEEP